jgi:hypothetical protein
MPRTALTKKTALGPYGNYTAGTVTLSLQAADVSNKNSFVCGPNDIVIAQNSGASPYTVTITSAADPLTGRSGDITTYSLAAGEIAVFGPFKAPGWMQTDGSIYLEASNAAVKFSPVTIPVL